MLIFVQIARILFINFHSNDDYFRVGWLIIGGNREDILQILVVASQHHSPFKMAFHASHFSMSRYWIVVMDHNGTVNMNLSSMVPLILLLLEHYAFISFGNNIWNNFWNNLSNKLLNDLFDPWVPNHFVVNICFLFSLPFFGRFHIWSANQLILKFSFLLCIVKWINLVKV